MLLEGALLLPLSPISYENALRLEEEEFLSVLLPNGIVEFVCCIVEEGCSFFSSSNNDGSVVSTDIVVSVDSAAGGLLISKYSDIMIAITTILCN